ncbi:MAG: VTT domain-containing protein [Candidatus Pacebacteria bacterium]|nr:VTT domain-containing protein [Candidatus Paceibacterota bacterium]
MDTPKKTKPPFKETYADWTLGAVSFTESSFLPILTDPFLVAVTLAQPRRWVWYVVLTTVTSVLGGLFGYMLGAVFFDVIGERIVAFYSLESVFEKTVVSLDNNAFLFTLIGAVTPIPYKLVAIVGGLTKINIPLFIVASIIGRALRFGLVGYITKTFGEYALAVFTRRFGFATVAIVCGVGAYALMVLVK